MKLKPCVKKVWTAFEQKKFLGLRPDDIIVINTVMSRRHLSWKVKMNVDALCILWFMLFMFLVIVQQNYSFIIQTDYQLWFQNKSKTWVNKWSCLVHLIIRATEQNIICTEKAGHENTESLTLTQIFSSTQSQIPASFPILLWKQWA